MNVLKRFLTAYGEHMEFCQVQLNWLDWEFQHGKEKVALLNEWKIPIWVKETSSTESIMQASVIRR